MRFGTTAAGVVVAALVLSGCDSSSPEADADGPPAAAAAGRSSSSPAATPTEAVASGAVDAEARSVADQFLEAANAGDRDAVAALFAPDARFDSVGRIYDGRDEIMDRFLGPEVIDAGGRYTELSARQDGDRLVVEYDYDTGYGGQEHFTYAYQVRDGLIRDVLGRYV